MPRYSEEFKREAIRLVREERMLILQAARVTGANHNTIREWIKKVMTPMIAKTITALIHL